jgi:hypothetical protein
MDLVVVFMHWPLYPKEKCPNYPLNKMLVGPQNWSGCTVEEIIFCPCQEANNDLLDIQPVT